MPKKVLLIDNFWFFRQLWMLGCKEGFAFLHAPTIAEARKLLQTHPDIFAVVVDACVDSGWLVKVDTCDLIREMKKTFTGHIIAAPSQPWHFRCMREAGCTHHTWKWNVGRLLRKLLTQTAPTQTP